MPPCLCARQHTVHGLFLHKHLVFNEASLSAEPTAREANFSWNGLSHRRSNRRKRGSLTFAIIFCKKSNCLKNSLKFSLFLCESLHSTCFLTFLLHSNILVWQPCAVAVYDRSGLLIQIAQSIQFVGQNKEGFCNVPTSDARVPFVHLQLANKEN